MCPDEEECPTPTHTSVSSETISHPPLDMNETILYAGAAPWKSNKYIIRDPESKLVIALRNDVLGLFSERYYYGGAGRWRSIENGHMWLGFRNIISGTYIGHDGKGKFVANAKRHSDWECFCTRQHPSGGHLLLMKEKKDDLDGFFSMTTGGKDNKKLLASTKQEGGTAWEFIRVDPGFEF